ncbi:envelope biogenesis factor ElyC [Erwinia psidii]|uniref:Envelope biogenesis factor ElyC n=1 Tax=Erwinia psidii TaxID=69224 RepID=A0A3N6SE71_9GAMM|nr:envelope biogenesis factor ElyC [Erwinia psidii]MCX8957395.1 envelope biogenesis factor ElyC [Erwinia psidii]MCX8959765.1 envelope biogenesis factor ElyC [Erwinia psidii]MCX8964708.1 envelope biogenesis factor ElyC [Erwinia psidii]RQM38183.1 envelope biogenesis factor ElyC [Erwinia psidii]
MLFVLKKVIGSLLLPLPLLLMLMTAGLLLLWFSRWQKTGKIILSCTWLILILLSLQPVADGLLRPTENRYPTWQQQQKIDYVVVLGGGYTWDANWAPSANMLNNSLPRLTEGIRLWRENPGAKMIFTGAKAQHNPLSSAEVTSRVAQSLGVPASEIITLDRPRDTRQEANEVAKVVGHHPFLLVTSASHLPRAMIFFRQQGLNPFPAPANQLAISSPLNFWEKAIPSPLWLSHSETAMYEMLGRLWQRMTSSASVKPEE